ncbi:MAG: hypothetical protein LBP35_04245 [Candidatus Ancillula trichonymphae]|nr:hypothetical protein [Candidatus Ancillula trichonymphae]
MGRPLRAKSIAASTNRTLIMTDEGKLYLCGTNPETKTPVLRSSGVQVQSFTPTSITNQRALVVPQTQEEDPYVVVPKFPLHDMNYASDFCSIDNYYAVIFGDKIYLWGKYGSNTVELYKISSDDNSYTSVSCSKDYLFAINIQGQIESVNITTGGTFEKVDAVNTVLAETLAGQTQIADHRFIQVTPGDNRDFMALTNYGFVYRYHQGNLDKVTATSVVSTEDRWISIGPVIKIRISDDPLWCYCGG